MNLKPDMATWGKWRINFQSCFANTKSQVSTGIGAVRRDGWTADRDICLTADYH